MRVYCPLLSEYSLFPSAYCKYGLYRLMVRFEELNNNFEAGNLESSLVGMGVVIKELPLFLESCSQPKIAQAIKENFPDECLTATGTMMHELSKHVEEILIDVVKAQLACPAFRS